MLPNSVNMAFHFPTVIRFYLLFLFFPLLYTSMNRYFKFVLFSESFMLRALTLQKEIRCHAFRMYHLRCKKLGIRQHERNRKKDDDYDYEELELE